MTITHAELLRCRHYDPLSGVFTYLTGRLAGKQAGCAQQDGLYIAVKIGPKSYHAHKLAWFYVHGQWPTGYLIHVNNIKTDNRLENIVEEEQFSTPPGSLISHYELSRFVHYEPDTGIFTWKVRRRGYPAGTVIGCPDPRGYIFIGLNQRHYHGHRLAWFYVHGRWPANEIDHVNCDKSDNRIANLREATRQQNTGNVRRGPTNKSGFKGVNWCAKAGKWRAEIGCGRSRHLGYFDKAEDAGAAYADAAIQVFGEFARVA